MIMMGKVTLFNCLPTEGFPRPTDQMKNRLIILFLFLVILPNLGKSQDLPLTKEAATLCQSLDYQGAETAINKALESGEARHPYTWYVKGFIHKEIYKNKEANDRNSLNRDIAVEGFSKCLTLDTHREYSDMCRAGLKFLATTYYNDALTRTRDFDLNNSFEAENLFRTFTALMHQVDPTFQINTCREEFLKNMAQRYFVLWQMDLDNIDIADKAIEQYNEALLVDSLDSDTYYNKAVIYYNRAVFQYRKIDINTDFTELIEIQQNCASLIKNHALENMNTAYQLDPERGEIVRGLLFIHRALEHEQDVTYFKQEINRLIQEGKISSPFPDNEK